MAPAGSLPLLLLFLGTLGVRRGASDNGFDLTDALDDEKKPTLKPQGPKKPPAGGDFDLTDALGNGGDEPKPQPKPRPRPGSGEFSNTDLEDVVGGGGGGGGAKRDHGSGSGDPEAGPAQPQGLVPGVVAAVVAAVVGAVSSFVAYQRKRLCFREHESSVV